MYDEGRADRFSLLDKLQTKYLICPGTRQNVCNKLTQTRKKLKQKINCQLLSLVSQELRCDHTHPFTASNNNNNDNNNNDSDDTNKDDDTNDNN